MSLIRSPEISAMVEDLETTRGERDRARTQLSNTEAELERLRQRLDQVEADLRNSDEIRAALHDGVRDTAAQMARTLDLVEAAFYSGMEFGIVGRPDNPTTTFREWFAAVTKTPVPDTGRSN